MLLKVDKKRLTYYISGAFKVAGAPAGLVDKSPARGAKGHGRQLTAARGRGLPAEVFKAGAARLENRERQKT